MTHYYVATAALRMGDRKAAAEHYRACLAIREGLAGDPKAKLNVIDLMIARARCGQHQIASKTAEELITKPPLDARVYFQAACGFSLCAGAVAEEPASPETKALVGRYTEKAFQALRLALGAGWKNVVDIETDPDLDAIRGAPGFEAIVAEYRKAAARERPLGRGGRTTTSMRILVAIPHFFDLTREVRHAPGHGSLFGRPGAEDRGALGVRVGLAPTLRRSAGYHRHRRGARRKRRTPGSRRQSSTWSSARRGASTSCLACPWTGTPCNIIRPTPSRHCSGFECHAALYERLGDYDFYGYLEDDLILRDPWFFAKLGWFQGQVGPGAVLLPNRYEVARGGVAWKAYIDGDLPPEVTAPFQNIAEAPELKGTCLGHELTFRRPSNPHSGCFFLTNGQLRAWAARRDFLDRDTRFVGPLESAATLGLMRALPGLQTRARGGQLPRDRARRHRLHRQPPPPCPNMKIAGRSRLRPS